MLTAVVYNKDGIDVGVLLLRVMVGFTLVAHGYNHIWGGGKIKGTAGWFESLGLKPGILHAWLASITELVCGVMLMLGFFTAFGAAGCVGVMTVAFITNHYKNGFFIFRPGEGYEYVLNLLVAGLALSALGAGKFSLDHELVRKNANDLYLYGFKGLAVAGLVGIGGAVLLLIVFWRPEPKPATDG